jgi:hypothetical protein
MHLKQFFSLMTLAAGVAHAQMNLPGKPIGPGLDGACASGASYKLQLYLGELNGKPLKTYLYEGPLGTGSVVSNDTMETAKAFVCREKGDQQWLPDLWHGE